MYIRKLFPYPSPDLLTKAERSLFEVIEGEFTTLKSLREKLEFHSVTLVGTIARSLKEKGYVDFVRA